MKRTLIATLALPLLIGCGNGGDAPKNTGTNDSLAKDTFAWQADQFADVRVLRYTHRGANT